MKKRLRFIAIVNRSSITNNKDEDTENKEKKARLTYTLDNRHIHVFHNEYYLTYLFRLQDKSHTEKVIRKTSLSVFLLWKFELNWDFMIKKKLFFSNRSIDILFIDRCHKYPIPNIIVCNIILYKVSLPISVYLLVGWCINAYTSVYTIIALFTVPSFIIVPLSIRLEYSNTTRW
jgi:hypothetical protein